MFALHSEVDFYVIYHYLQELFLMYTWIPNKKGANKCALPQSAPSVSMNTNYDDAIGILKLNGK